MSTVQEKIKQAIEILNEQDIDMWLTFVRESSTMPDPAIELVVGQHCTWQTAWVITRGGATVAVAGSLDVAAIKDHGNYGEVLPYLEGIAADLRSVVERFQPKTIALNFSRDSVMADGLTHGMYLTLCDALGSYAERFVSSERILSALRGRKSPAEIAKIQRAIELTLTIYDEVTGFLSIGQSEQQVANFILGRTKHYGVETAWDPEHCPAVFTGPEHAGAHFRPTDRKIEGGHVLNIDFGVRFEGYCSDLQRTWYLRRPGEREVPAEVQRGFDVIVESIQRAAAALKPGAVAWEIDDVARSYIVEKGYPEYPHGLGHQVGRVAHDGGIGLLPRWERYGKLPYGTVERGQVFTIEPRLPIEGYGVATIEEIVQVTDQGAKFLSKPQRELIVV